MDTLLRGYSAYQKPKPPSEVTFTVKYFSPTVPEGSQQPCPPSEGAWPLKVVASYTKTLENLSPGQTVTFTVKAVLGGSLMMFLDIDKCTIEYDGEVIEFPEPTRRYSGSMGAGTECIAYEHKDYVGQSLYLPQTKAASNGVEFTAYNITKQYQVTNYYYKYDDTMTVKIPT